MKKMTLLLSVGILSAFLASCSQSSSTSATCAKSGMFGGQTECQSSIGGVGSCSMTTISSSGSSTVCWQQSANITTNTNTSTSTGLACVGSAAPPWTLGAWTPANCAPGVTSRTRTVTCDYNCACSGTQPSTTSSCSGDLYNNAHYTAECTSLGGNVETVDGFKVCSVPASSCPGGWSQLTAGNGFAYTKTTAGSGVEHTSCTGGRATRYTGYHNNFVPAMPVESISLCTWKTCTGCKAYTTFYANISRVACY